MAFKTETEFPEYSDEQLKQAVGYVQDATEIDTLEEGKFSILKKENYYVLKRTKDDKVLGWVQLESKTLFDEKYNHVNVIYILPDFREEGAGLILIYGVKELSKLPLFFDSAVFDGGERLLNSMNKKHKFKITTIDKKTGDKKDYTDGDITLDPHKNAIIVENDKIGLYQCCLPGDPSVKTYISRFQELYEGLEK